MVNRIFQSNHLSQRWQQFITSGLLLVVIFLAFTNITRFPKPWFDEGSHLHVPKTLVEYGVYADISSEGFRYYGPTIGVGPTVMLPIAAVFKMLGVGLLQARFVIAVYMLLAIYVFYRLVLGLSKSFWLTIAAIALLLSSRSVLFLNYGRQVLGEVPGLFFLLAGLVLWFVKWENNSWKRLAVVGLLFGLAMITKYQYLLFLLPMIGIMWFVNVIYYKKTSYWNFIVPGVVAGVCFAVWQAITILNLGPATAMENLTMLRASAEGAAFTFDPGQIGENFGELTTRSVFMGALIPALVYGFIISIPRSSEAQKWGVLYLLVILNLGWYVVASIGWIRYAFLGLSLSTIFIAKLFHDTTSGFKLASEGEQGFGTLRSILDRNNAFRWALVFWLIIIILIPMAKNVYEVISPGHDAIRELTEYLDENIPQDAIIETWEPEMGFFTDHNYHYPPNALLALAVNQIYSGGKPVQDSYDFVQTEKPEYLLIGEFSKWVDMYPLDQLSDQYELIMSIYDYDLYKRINQSTD